jgi:hypothetical protein
MCVWVKWMVVVLVMNVACWSQIATFPTPTPNPNSRQSNVPAITADNSRYDRLRSLDLVIPNDAAETHPLLDSKRGMYRKPSKGEIEILAVSQPILAKYASFLKEPHTGVVKLNGEGSCVTDVDVVIASEKCVAFKMPGGGTAYSFRTESYRLSRLADLILLDGVFRTGGVFQQVVMADLGDVELDSVTLQSKGLSYLTRLKPVSDSDEFIRFDGETAKGVEADGFLYRKGHPVRINSTYALRSIAYRGKYMRSLDGVWYDELEFDRRRDVIVAFRVVDKDTAGNVTIVWKRLRDAEAPQLKVKR